MTVRRNWIRWGGVGAALCALSLLSCKEAVMEPLTVATVEVAGGGVNLRLGQTAQLTPTLKSAKGYVLPKVGVVWSSSDGAKASITSSGQVTAVSRGPVTLTASAGGATGTAAVTVIGVQSVSLAPETLSVIVTQTRAMTATTVLDPGVTVTPVWRSLDTTIARVDTAGRVTARTTTGHARVEVTAEDKKDTAVVRVVPVPVASLLIRPESATVGAGQTVQLTAIPRDSIGTELAGRTVAWSSVSASIASVSSTGLVTGISNGKTEIRGTVEGKTSAATITVDGPVASVQISPGQATLTLGESQTFSVTAKDISGKVLLGRSISWSVTDSLIAKVSSSGDVTGTAPGTTTITATVEQQKASVPVTVNGVGEAPASLIGGGNQHSCAIVSSGSIACWGEGGAGQLGTAYARRAEPVPIVGNRIFMTLSSGDFHSCGITQTGQLFCWGRNLEGQIGDGTLIDRFLPVAIVPTVTFKAVAAGKGHTCALTIAGAALCWGKNTNGQVGDGSTINRSEPVSVSGSRSFVGITVGANHSCAWTDGGQAFCWGRNAQGELGDGTTSARLIPTRVAGGLYFSEVTARGSHSCARTTMGVAYCWGVGSAGQLGTGSYPTAQIVPAQVSGPTKYIRLSAGEQFTCGIAADRTVHCWGRNTRGELGDGTSTSRAVPGPVKALSQVLAIGAGGEHHCAITASGAASCWGLNSSSQLGEVEAIRAPTAVSGISEALQISGGYFSTCTLSRTGLSTCWGNGLDVPTLVANGKTFTAIDHGDNFVCGIDSAKSVWCWGGNNAGKLGNGSEQYSAEPQAVLGGLQFHKISSFYTHTCGITVGKTIACWGANHVGQIDDSGLNRLTPVLIASTLSFTDISVGFYHSCALTTDGAMYCWGKEVSGSSALIPVLSAHRFTAIATVGPANNFCGVRLDKQVVCTNNANDANGRVIEGLSNASLIEGFEANLCALTTEKTIYCWGSNYEGQLGNPTFMSASSDKAISVSNISSAIAIGGSYRAPCAVLEGGAVACWGYNGNGETGRPPLRAPRTVIGGLTFYVP